MPNAAPQAIAITKAVEAVMRNDRGRLLSALISRLRDFHLAEEALQEAAMSALVHWGRSGLPASPQGWLLRVALRKAIDKLRGSARAGRNAADLARLAGDEADETDPEMIPDERLRLIFTCCHPALDPKSRVALTLRSIAGLSTAQIARAFLDAEPTMGQRLSRAKAKIGAARIPYVVPGPEDWAARLESVLAVIYLIFNAGYTTGPIDGRDLCDEAIFLARLIDRLRPGEAEVEGALALLLLTHARRAARVGADGATVPPPEQDRRLWDHGQIAEGLQHLNHALTRTSPGPYQIKAAIAALNVAEGPTDWTQIALLYRRLMQLEPTAVVQLNLCVALERAGQATTAMALLDALSDALEDYQPFHAARAEILARSGRADESRAAYDRAIALAGNPADAVFLRKRRDGPPPDQARPQDRR
jgi:RNA polymerase sigma factor (sigma-70 family)